MVVGGQGQDIITDYRTIKTKGQYKYLGVNLTSDGRDDKDIRNKIVQGEKIITATLTFIEQYNFEKH
jgi:hypothetical protein